jgi:hypothetical protein
VKEQEANNREEWGNCRKGGQGTRGPQGNGKRRNYIGLDQPVTGIFILKS